MKPITAEMELVDLITLSEIEARMDDAVQMYEKYMDTTSELTRDELDELD